MNLIQYLIIGNKFVILLLGVVVVAVWIGDLLRSRARRGADLTDSTDV